MNDRKIASFGIFGGGAWGTALAQTLARSGRRAVLWAREPDVAASIRDKRENSKFLSGIRLDDRLEADTDMAKAAACDVWLAAVPAQHSRQVFRAVSALVSEKGLDSGQPILLCAKGIEQKTLALPSAVAAQEFGGRHPLAVLSGPTFAAEVAEGKPTAITLACADTALAMSLAEAMGGRTFRPYVSGDVTGAQVGGAIKNVLAIACGIIAGYGMGDNSRAALITRGLAEISRLAVAMGGIQETMMGLSGLGDIVLTCSSQQSRNMSLGMALGRGEKLSDIMAARSSVAEGVYTASAARALAAERGVEMPIIAAVDDVLNQGASVDDTIAALLSRPLRME